MSLKGVAIRGRRVGREVRIEFELGAKATVNRVVGRRDPHFAVMQWCMANNAPFPVLDEQGQECGAGTYDLKANAAIVTQSGQASGQRVVLQGQFAFASFVSDAGATR